MPTSFWGHTEGAVCETSLLYPRAGCNQATLLFYNNILALPLMAGYMLLATREALDVVSYPLLDDVQFQVCHNHSKLPLHSPPAALSIATLRTSVWVGILQSTFCCGSKRAASIAAGL